MRSGTGPTQQGSPTATGPGQPSNTRFSFFNRRGPQPLLPQQNHQQAFPAPPPGAPQGAPQGALGPKEPPAPRDVQANQELVGGNWIFLVFLPYFASTALQDTHLRIGLIVGTAASAAVLLLGFLVWTINLRKVFPHILEVLMLVLHAVLLGVSYVDDATKNEILRTYNFITNSALAGTCLASMLVCYPVGYQNAQELVHKLYMGNSEVLRVGLYTTAVLTASLVSSCLLYLAPLCKGWDDRHWNALNLGFRLIYPCVATFLALLFVRFFPDFYLPNLAVVHGLNRKPPASLPGYLTDLMSLKPPSILDGTMYQSTVDAATKAREAKLMSRAASPAARTPRYGPSSTGGAMAQPSAPGMVDSGQMVTYGAGLYPRQDPSQALYTYFAAGPPAPPPLAVYAVYGDHDAYGHPYSAAPHDYSLPIGNPLLAAHPRQLPPVYGGSGRVAPYPGGPQQGRFTAAINDMRRHEMYGHTQQAGAPGYGRPFASAGGAIPAYGGRAGPYGGGGPGPHGGGGAGPYGVNMPLGAMAASGHGSGGGGGRTPPMSSYDMHGRAYNMDQDPDRDPYGADGMGAPPRFKAGQGGAEYTGAPPPLDGNPTPRMPEGARHWSDGGGGYGLDAAVRQEEPQRQRPQQLPRKQDAQQREQQQQRRRDQSQEEQLRQHEQQLRQHDRQLQQHEQLLRQQQRPMQPPSFAPDARRQPPGSRFGPEPEGQQRPQSSLPSPNFAQHQPRRPQQRPMPMPPTPVTMRGQATFDAGDRYGDSAAQAKWPPPRPLPDDGGGGGGYGLDSEVAGDLGARPYDMQPAPLPPSARGLQGPPRRDSEIGFGLHAEVRGDGF